MTNCIEHVVPGHEPPCVGGLETAQGSCPLLRLLVRVHVRGDRALVVMDQDFVVRLQDSATVNEPEGRYRLPLTPGLRLVGYRIQVGSRTIRGRWLTVAEARLEYALSLQARVRDGQSGLARPGEVMVPLGGLRQGEAVAACLVFRARIPNGPRGRRLLVPRVAGPSLDDLAAVVELSGAPDVTIEFDEEPLSYEPATAAPDSLDRRMLDDMGLGALLDEAAEYRTPVAVAAPPMGRPRLGRILLDMGVVSEDDLSTALDYQRRTGRRLGFTLFELGLVGLDDVARALARQFGLDFVDLSGQHPDIALCNCTPVHFRLDRLVTATRLRRFRKLELATSDPTGDFLPDEWGPMFLWDLVSPWVVVAEDGDRLRLLLPRAGTEDDTEVHTLVPFERGRMVASGGEAFVPEAFVRAAPEGLADVYAKHIGPLGVVDDCFERLERFDAKLSHDWARYMVDAVVANALAEGACELLFVPRGFDVLVTGTLPGRSSLLHFLPAPADRLVPAVLERWCTGVEVVDLYERRARATFVARGLAYDVHMRFLQQELVHRGRMPWPFYWEDGPPWTGEAVHLTITPRNADVRRLDALGLDEPTLARLDAAIRVTDGVFVLAGQQGAGKRTLADAILADWKERGADVLVVENTPMISVPGVRRPETGAPAYRNSAALARYLRASTADVVFIEELYEAEVARAAFELAVSGRRILTTVVGADVCCALERLSPWVGDARLLFDGLRLIHGQHLVRVEHGTPPDFRLSVGLVDVVAELVGRHRLAAWGLDDVDGAHVQDIFLQRQVQLFEDEFGPNPSLETIVERSLHVKPIPDEEFEGTEMWNERSSTMLPISEQLVPFEELHQSVACGQGPEAWRRLLDEAGLPSFVRTMVTLIFAGRLSAIDLQNWTASREFERR